MGSRIIPLSDFFTLSTSTACFSGDMARWSTPMPPSRANAMAKRPSVTVSMAALKIGILIVICRDTCVEQSTSPGMISDLARHQYHIVKG